MKNTTRARKKLTLHLQTVRQLTADQLAHAAGGSIASNSCSNNSCILHACPTQ